MDKHDQEAKREAYRQIIKEASVNVRELTDDMLTSKEAGLLEEVKELGLDIKAGWVDSADVATRAFQLILGLGDIGWERLKRKREAA